MKESSHILEDVLLRELKPSVKILSILFGDNKYIRFRFNSLILTTPVIGNHSYSVKHLIVA